MNENSVTNGKVSLAGMGIMMVFLSLLLVSDSGLYCKITVKN